MIIVFRLYTQKQLFHKRDLFRVVGIHLLNTQPHHHCLQQLGATLYKRSTVSC